MYPVKAAPVDVIEQETRRFGEKRLATIIEASRLPVSTLTVRAYCHWFLGGDFGWRSEWGGDGWSADRNQRLLTAQIADHLAGATSPGPWGDYRYSLHTKCKQGRHQDRCYYWTPCLIIDLDNGPGASQQLHERYRTCRSLFGPAVVIRTPRGGLHAYWPLRVPVSVLGCTARGPLKIPVLVPDMLSAAGLLVTSGNVEVFPSPRNTLRVALGGGSMQVDSETLEPISFACRGDQITRLVADMHRLAESAPFDALLAAQRTALSTRGPLGAVAGKNQAARAESLKPDVHRLLTEGLYEGLCRHEAALALARHWMLWLRWNADDTAAELFEWTRTMTNRRSKDALQIEAPQVAQCLCDEYRRICVNLERKIRSGVLTLRTTAHGARALLTASEREAAFGTGASIAKRSERYRLEVFLFCFLGFAKRYGTPAPNLSDDAARLPTFVEVAATTMQKWPYCSGNGYVKRLRFAYGCGVITPERNYRAPANGRPGRARTYHVDLDGLPGEDSGLDAWAIIEAKRRATDFGLRIAHPQEVEHAVVARANWGGLLVERYGRRAAGRVSALAGAYDVVVAKPKAIVA